MSTSSTNCQNPRVDSADESCSKAILEESPVNVENRFAYFTCFFLSCIHGCASRDCEDPMISATQARQYAASSVRELSRGGRWLSSTMDLRVEAMVEDQILVKRLQRGRTLAFSDEILTMPGPHGQWLKVWTLQSLSHGFQGCLHHAFRLRFIPIHIKMYSPTLPIKSEPLNKHNPIVHIHGFSQSSQAWNGLVDLL